MAINTSNFVKAIEEFGNEIIEALVTDVSSPEFRQAVRDITCQKLSYATGLNFNSMFLRPKFDEIYADLEQGLLEKLGLVVSNPPYSVDASSEVVKEIVNENVDSFANRIKAKLGNTPSTNSVHNTKSSNISSSEIGEYQKEEIKPEVNDYAQHNLANAYFF